MHTVSSMKRNLGLAGVIAISLAVMGPSMAVSLNPQAIAEQVGGAVPTAYLLAVIPLAIITASFVILTRRRGSAGSLFGFVGVEIGPRAGTAAGLWLAAAYVAVMSITALAFGIFMTTLAQEYGLSSAPSWLPILLAFLILPVTAYLAGRTIRTLGALLLVLEGLTMLAILVVTGLTFARLATDGGPQGQTVDWSAFRFEGVSAGAVALALTFGILSSAGFEGAAAAGEETDDPKRTIPRALIWTTVLTSAFFIAVTMVGVWAFGTAPKQLEQFSASGSLPADIANAYVGDAMGDLITLGGAVSAFACMIAAQVAGGRIIYAFGRDGVLPRSLGELSSQGTPVRGSLVIAVIGVAFLAFSVVTTAGDAFSAFELTSDTTGLVISGAYAAACAAASVVLWRDARGRRWAWVPGLGVLFLIGLIVLQLFPIPSGWELIAPVVAVLIFIVGAGVGRSRGRRAAAALSEPRS